MQIRDRSSQRETGALRTDEARGLPGVRADLPTLTDLELLSVGALSPMSALIGADDHRSVTKTGRLLSGAPIGLPIALPISEPEAEALLRSGLDSLAVLGPDDETYAVIEHPEVYTIDPDETSQGVFGTTDPSHPGVSRLMSLPALRLSGEVTRLRRAPLAEREGVLDPGEVRALRDAHGWRTMVGFQTRNPVHRAHEYIQKVALESVDGLLLHPLVGETKADDLPQGLRMRAYRALLDRYYPTDRVLLSGFPASMRYAGPREALFHAVVRRNYGCTHFIVGRDHAGVGGFYGPLEAQAYVAGFGADLGITILAFAPAFYCRVCQSMATERTCPHEPSEHVSLSGTEVRQRLRAGEPLPAWFTRPEVAEVLKEALLCPSAPSSR